jgi:TrpR-related protein YerC/YecD
MKSHRNVSPRQEAAAAGRLFAAIASLRTAEECRAFLRDLCTPAELQAMADRWAVVDFLKRGLPYREIHRLTGVSVTTIGRVARFLDAGNGGYAIAMGRLADGKPSETREPKGAAGRTRRGGAAEGHAEDDGRRLAAARRAEVSRHG